jgi:ribosomal-protein-alanine N-acetyltransferase
MASGTDHVWTVSEIQSAIGPGSGRSLLAARMLDAAGDVTMVGFCALQVVEDEAEIHELVVARAVRRLGLGRALVNAALAVAHHRGASRAELEVRRSNLPAQALYLGLGFDRARVRRGYYRTPDEDAVVMARSLSPWPFDPLETQ